MDSERIKKLRASYEQKNKELASMKAKAEADRKSAQEKEMADMRAAAERSRKTYEQMEAQYREDFSSEVNQIISEVSALTDEMKKLTADMNEYQGLANEVGIDDNSGPFKGLGYGFPDDLYAEYSDKLELGGEESNPVIGQYINDMNSMGSSKNRLFTWIYKNPDLDFSFCISENNALAYKCTEKSYGGEVWDLKDDVGHFAHFLSEQDLTVKEVFDDVKDEFKWIQKTVEDFIEENLNNLEASEESTGENDLNESFGSNVMDTKVARKFMGRIQDLIREMSKFVSDNEDYNDLVIQRAMKSLHGAYDHLEDIED